VSTSARRRWWPQTLAARIALILVAGLVLSHVLTFGLIVYERYQTATDMMLGNMERELASSVALLDRLPAAERPEWLGRLSRRGYDFSLDAGQAGPAPEGLAERVADSIEKAIGKQYPVTASMVGKNQVQAHLRLSDGSALTIALRPTRGMPLSPWLPLLLTAQLALLAACSWYAVRLATRPLEQLARAADSLGPDLQSPPLPVAGPTEVARAASAFNAMQERIAANMAERMQILAAVSHDLQTPITRMRLRTDLMDDGDERDKMQRDLLEMETLVREGVSFARTLHNAVEASCKVDLDALLASITADYADAGRQVALSGESGAAIETRPRALRRVLCNLIDNALKFAGQADIEVKRNAAGRIEIAVLDRGPGIPKAELEAVFQPFYRLETSRNRDTGGTGLGLAIARQLAQALGATLTLSAREGGGLAARLDIGAAANASATVLAAQVDKA
jgi:signal transduction histidine kinase